MKSKQNIWFISQISCLLIVVMYMRAGSTRCFVVFRETVLVVQNSHFGLDRFPPRKLLGCRAVGEPR